MPESRPTWVRYRVVVLATAVAVLLYLDRFCLSSVDRQIKTDMSLEESQIAFIHSSFFLTYALGQIPFGYLTDRFGARRVLSVYMILWSSLTGMMGLARTFGELLVYRLGCGLFESGAYPACSGMIKRWIPFRQRGMASGIVSLGGRIGGAVTPWLTPRLMVLFGEMPLVVSAFGESLWRPTFLFFGAVGILLAIYFAVRHRDDPQAHPDCNDAELRVIQGETQTTVAGNAEAIQAKPTLRSPGATPPAATQIDIAAPMPLVRLLPRVLASVDLWIVSIYQFGWNFGWALFLTYFNRYLSEVHDVPPAERGMFVSLVMLASLPSLIVGGWLTDRLTRNLGVRWGRAIPMIAPRIAAAIPYALCAFVPAGYPWVAVGLLATAAFLSDLTIASVWAFNMDVGGRNVGFVLGWGNMWGNLGAFASPLIVAALVANLGWSSVFLAGGGVFALIGLSAFLVDPRRKVAE